MEQYLCMLFFFEVADCITLSRSFSSIIPFSFRVSALLKSGIFVVSGGERF